MNIEKLHEIVCEMQPVVDEEYVPVEMFVIDDYGDMDAHERDVADEIAWMMRATLQQLYTLDRMLHEQFATYIDNAQEHDLRGVIRAFEEEIAERQGKLKEAREWLAKLRARA